MWINTVELREFKLTQNNPEELMWLTPACFWSLQRRRASQFQKQSRTQRGGLCTPKSQSLPSHLHFQDGYLNSLPSSQQLPSRHTVNIPQILSTSLITSLLCSVLHTRADWDLWMSISTSPHFIKLFPLGQRAVSMSPFASSPATNLCPPPLIISTC